MDFEICKKAMLDTFNQIADMYEFSNSKNNELEKVRKKWQHDKKEDDCFVHFVFLKVFGFRQDNCIDITFKPTDDDEVSINFCRETYSSQNMKLHIVYSKGPEAISYLIELCNILRDNGITFPPAIDRLCLNNM